MLFGPSGPKMFYLRPKARQILSLFHWAIYSGSLFFPLVSRAQLVSALEMTGLFCLSAARHDWLCTNSIFHKKEYFKNKPLTHVVHCDMYWEEWRKRQSSVSHLLAFKSSFVPIADDRSCSLPSPFCKIECAWDISDSWQYGTKASYFGAHGTHQSCFLWLEAPADVDTCRLGQEALLASMIPLLPCKRMDLTIFLQLRTWLWVTLPSKEKASGLIYNLGLRGCRRPLPLLLWWGSSHQTRSHH